MRIYQLPVCVAAVTALSVPLVGCGSGSMETPDNQVGGASSPLDAEMVGDDHQGHDHGGETAAGHLTQGPHGGHLIELGNEEYHAELLHDEDSHRVTIHLLDGTGKEPVSVPLREITLQLFRDGTFVTYALKAVPSPGSATSTVSQFEIVDDGLCDALCHHDELRGRLQLTLNGTPYTGTIERCAHDGHNHDAHAGHAHHDGHAEDGHDEDEQDEDEHNHDSHSEEGHSEEGHDH